MNGIFLVSSLQGSTAKDLVPENFRKSISSIVVRLPDSRILTRSDAILAIAVRMGGIYSMARLAYLVPRIIRDFIYDLIARNRKIFPLRAQVCERPTPELARRILP